MATNAETSNLTAAETVEGREALAPAEPGSHEKPTDARPSGGDRQPEGEDAAVEFPLTHRPDDPGVDPAKAQQKKRFGLF